MVGAFIIVSPPRFFDDITTEFHLAIEVDFLLKRGKRKVLRRVSCET